MSGYHYLFCFIILSLTIPIVGFFLKRNLLKINVLILAMMYFIGTIISIYFTNQSMSISGGTMFKRRNSIELLVEKVYTNNYWLISYIVMFTSLVLLNIWLVQKAKKNNLDKH